MHVLDPIERSFAFAHAARFKDLETGDQITTTPGLVQASYRREMQAFLDRYKRECREHMIDYVLLDTSTPFDVALVRYLNRREQMF